MRLFPVIAAAALLGACNDTATKQAEGSGQTASPAATPQANPPTAIGGFVPLQSAEVKDAIHRALVTGETQRWQDGPWSGYAVPSRATLANGCRTIRYTIDQQPDAPLATINACDANRSPSPGAS